MVVTLALAAVAFAAATLLAVAFGADLGPAFAFGAMAFALAAFARMVLPWPEASVPDEPPDPSGSRPARGRKAKAQARQRGR